MLILVKIIALIIGLAIAYGLARIGKNKLIGFNWAFFFGLLNPIIALILIFIGRRDKTLSHPIKLGLNFIAIIMILYGLLMLYGSYTTQISSISDQKLEHLSENLKVISGEKNIGNASSFEFINYLTSYIGRISGGGILSLVLDPDTYASNDYRVKRYFRFYAGLILISLGAYVQHKTRTNKV